MSEQEQTQEKKRYTNPLKFLFDKEAKEGYVPNRELFDYSAALAGQNATYGIVSGWLFYFCTNILGISTKNTGLIMSVSRIWDAINDIMIGAFIDRRKYRPGNKLHPFLKKLPILVGVLSAVMFIDFNVAETTAVVIVLCVYIAWDMAYSFQDVALWGTMALISPHPEERSRVSQWLNIGVGAGSGLVGLLPLVLGARDLLHTSERVIFLLAGIIFGFGGELLSILACRTKERVLQTEAPRKESFFKSITILRHNKMLLLLILAQILGGLSITVPWIYFFKYCVSYQIGSLNLNGETVQFVYGLLTAIPGAFALFVATKLADKLGGMRHVLIVAQASSIVLRVAAFFIGYQTLPRMLLVVILMAVTSLPGGISGIALRALICDSIDYVEWKTGKRTEGISCSLQNFTAKITSALQAAINAAILGYLHFDGKLPGITGQTPEFYKAQWPLFILGPAVGAILYLIPVLCIRYTAKQKEQVERELKQRREQEAEKEPETVSLL